MEAVPAADQEALGKAATLNGKPLVRIIVNRKLKTENCIWRTHARPRPWPQGH
jgi:hypothetical protein